MKYCNDVSKLLDKFYNQLLERDQEVELFNHFRNCPDCRSKFKDDYKLFKALLISSDDRVLQPALSEKIIRKVCPPVRRIPRYCMAAAAVILLCVGLYFALGDSREPSRAEVEVIQSNVAENWHYSLSGSDQIEIIQDGKVYGIDDCKNLKPGAELYTFNNAEVNSSFMKIALNNNAHITFENAGIFFHYGTAKFDFKKLEAPYYVKTCNAVITITGTSFSLYKHSVDSESLTFELTHGSVEIRHTNGKTLILKNSGKIQLTDSEIKSLDNTELIVKSELTVEARSFSMEK